MTTGPWRSLCGSVVIHVVVVGSLVVLSSLASRGKPESSGGRAVGDAGRRGKASAGVAWALPVRLVAAPAGAPRLANPGAVAPLSVPAGELPDEMPERSAASGERSTSGRRVRASAERVKAAAIADASREAGEPSPREPTSADGGGGGQAGGASSTPGRLVSGGGEPVMLAGTGGTESGEISASARASTDAGSSGPGAESGVEEDVIPPAPLHLAVPILPRGLDPERVRGARVTLLVYVEQTGEVSEVRDTCRPVE